MEFYGSSLRNHLLITLLIFGKMLSLAFKIKQIHKAQTG